MNIETNKKGSVTVLTLLIAVVLTITGIASLNLAYHARLKTIKEVRKMSARIAADAGMTKALYAMNQSGWDDNSLPEATNEKIPNWNASFSYSVAGDATSGYTVTSVGDYSSGQKTVKATLKAGDSSLFEFAIFGDRQVVFKSSSLVGKKNNSSSGNKAKIGTNSKNCSAIKIYNNAFIDGDVYAGYQGEPSYVIWKKVNPTGTIGALSAAVDMTVVSARASLRSQYSKGDITSNTTLTKSGKYRNVNLGNRRKLTINGDVELYLTGYLLLGNRALLTISPNSSLKLYIDGNIDGRNGSDFINKTNDASNFQVYGGNSCRTIILRNKSSFYGAIYAPKASVYLHNSATSYGSVICYKYEQKNSSKFYYDEGLASVSGSSSSGQYEILQWQEF